MSYAASLSLDTQASKQTASSEIGQYFRGKGAFYWKVEKILSVVAPIFATLGYLALGTLGCCFTASFFIVPFVGPAVILTLITILKISGISLAIVGPLALLTAPPVVNHLGDNGHHGEGPFSSDLFGKRMRQRIDLASLQELTEWRGGDWDARTSSWRDCDWASIFDFYYHVRTPQELVDRIHRENAQIPFNEIGEICRTNGVHDRVIQAELRIYIKGHIGGLSCEQIALRNFDLFLSNDLMSLSQEERDLLSRAKELLKIHYTKKSNLEKESQIKIGMSEKAYKEAMNRAKNWNYRYENLDVRAPQQQHDERVRALREECERQKQALEEELRPQIEAINADFERIRVK